MPFAKKKMGFSRPPRLFLRNDPQNAADPLGKTGFYDPEKESITLYTTGRHPKDILRSLAHELQHHTQKCNGEFDNIKNMGEEGYAQNNPQLRAMEYKAYMASMCVRDFEDGLKLQKETIYYEHLQKGDNVSMSIKKWKNQELKSLLSEAWGFKMDLSKLNESKEETLEEYGYAAQDAYNKCMERCDNKEGDDKEKCKANCSESEQAPSGSPEAPGPKSGMSMDEQELYEMGCGDHGHDHGDESDEMMISMDDQSIEALADRAMDAIQAMLAAAGGEDEMMGDEMMDDEAMEEGGAAHRDDSRNRRRTDPRTRPMEESKLHVLVRETIKELSKGK